MSEAATPTREQDTASVLELRDVTRTFMIRKGIFSPRQPLHAVNGVNLGVRKGEVLGLVGESGCGKSTLAKMLLGLLPATSGEILIDGEPLANHDRSFISRKIQPIFQDPYSSLNPRKSIADVISLPLRVHNVGDASNWRKQVEECLDVVGLPRRVYESYPNQLSGGQRQRVAIARALIMRPEVVICDEPTSALDVSVQSQILNLLMDLREEFGLTYVLISHNLAVVEHMATKVAVMYLGRIVEQATTEDIFTHARHPYTRALLQSVLTPEPDLGVPDSQLGLVFPNPVDPPPGCTFHPRCVQAMPVCSTRKPRPIRSGSSMVECHLHDEQTAPPD